MFVLYHVPFVKACCLSQRSAVHTYFTVLCRPLITLPSMPRCLLIFPYSSCRPTHAVRNSWLMHLRYRHHLFPSFRTPVPVRLVYVFPICSSSFIIHASLFPGHVQP